MSDNTNPFSAFLALLVGHGRRLGYWLRNHEGVQRSLRILGWSALVGWFIFGFLVLALRWFILPQIENYRPDVERALSSSLGLKVTVGGISSGWRGLNPDLVLQRLQVYDREGRPALAFETVDAALSWTSIPLGKLVLSRLEINAPELVMRREADGRIFIAGLPLNTEASGSGFSDWLLSQRRVVIRDARLSWDDVKRGAPRLELKRVNLLLENFASHHSFGLVAEAPANLASRLDVRGDFRGRDLAHLEDWHGEAYASMDFADLAVWRQWVDYPLELPRGVGGLRLWLGVEDGRLTSATADLALKGVNLRLSKELPALDLASLEGRLQLDLPGRGFTAVAKALALTTQDGLRLEPTDFRLKYLPSEGTGSKRKPGEGEVSANLLDLTALKGLAAYLPLDDMTRQRLASYGPAGRLRDLKLGWQGDTGGLAAYNLKSRFERLGVQAVDGIPGFEGLSGSIEGSDKSGQMAIESQDAQLILPGVFVDPRVPLRHMSALLNWKMAREELQLELKKLSFDNQDAEGIAFGTYHRKPGEKGVIDLTAQLSRGEGNAVWRYMPMVVNGDVRDWLQKSIGGGSSRDAKLVLKGDLKDFPFDGAQKGKGTFRVTGRFSGATLTYAPSWPGLQNITGDLLFEGRRMLIRGEKANLYGVNLTQVAAEITDLEATEEIIRITGNAAGPTQDFLRFIDESPVSERIDNFTEGMKAEGGGNLKLAITMPLRHLKDTTVQGDFQFVNNRLSPMPGMVPITDVNGRLQFSDKDVTVKAATGRLFGGPLSITAQTRNDGAVSINAKGTVSMAGMRKALDMPLLDHLSGTTSWRGSIAVKKRNADMLLESSLQGVASSLPEPFNKTAAESVPLRFEKELGEVKADGVSRHVLRLSLGKALNARINRHMEAGNAVVDNGAVALQAPERSASAGPSLPGTPDKGLAVAVNLKSVNLDFWRRMLAGGEGAATPSSGDQASAWPVNALALHTGEMTAFGRSFADVTLKAQVQDNTWRIQVAGKDVAGTLNWSGRGKGRLQARLQQFSIGEVKNAQVAEVEEPLKELPALDVVVDNFHLRGMSLGKLELDAVNRGNTWQVRRLAITNPEGNVSGSGQWRLSSTAPESRLTFKAEASNIGKLLERLGYPGAVRNGIGKLEGNLVWKGVPTSLDYPSLLGSLSVEASRGQFAKLEPGVGRLLGILSLQSIPRRLSLDFRDVFSEGFAFDAISGDVQVDKGVMTTRNLLIRGPAAHVFMSGEASLVKETQNLLVRVQPTLADSVAVGAMMVNPVAGVATYLAQKLLKDPLGRIFEFDYAISGSWTDPKVEKIALAPKLEKPVLPDPAYK